MWVAQHVMNTDGLLSQKIFKPAEAERSLVPPVLTVLCVPRKWC